jgi:hypothetical protein
MAVATTRRLARRLMQCLTRREAEERGLKTGAGGGVKSRVT